VPLTLRTQGGAGWSPGAQHAQQLEAWFVHVPGIKVVFAATPETDTYALRVSDGKIMWHYPLGKYSPGIATEARYYLALNGLLMAFEGTNS